MRRSDAHYVQMSIGDKIFVGCIGEVYEKSKRTNALNHPIICENLILSTGHNAKSRPFHLWVELMSKFFT